MITLSFYLKKLRSGIYGLILEIEITSFDETHISFQEKFTTYESKRNAVDLIEIDRIGGIMSLYSFIFIDENGELYSEEEKTKLTQKKILFKGR